MLAAYCAGVASAFTLLGIVIFVVDRVRKASRDRLTGRAQVSQPYDFKGNGIETPQRRMLPTDPPDKGFR